MSDSKRFAVEREAWVESLTSVLAQLHRTPISQERKDALISAHARMELLVDRVCSLTAELEQLVSDLHAARAVLEAVIVDALRELRELEQ